MTEEQISEHHPDLMRFVRGTRRRLREDWDLVIAISGEEGCGKSRLGAYLGQLIDQRFDLKKNVSYLPTENEIKTRFTALKRYQCYMIDEAIKSMYKMNFMSGLQQSLVQMWATERFQNKCTILILPRFKDLTENFRNHRVKIWIHVLTRGIAIVHARDDDPHVADPWHIKESENYKKKAFKRKAVSTIPIKRRLYVESKLSNFLFDFNFSDWYEGEKEEYNKLKEDSRKQHRLEELEKDKKENTQLYVTRKQRDLLIRVLVDEKNFKQNRLAPMLGITGRTLTVILKKEREEFAIEQNKKAQEESVKGVDKHLEEALRIEKARTSSGLSLTNN
tara:strand:- start:321 stop:1322 length:1002 start_codon:yes stop_codon:yes gene_type:complete